MNDKVISTLLNQACPSIQYRIRKEILEEEPEIQRYLDAILADTRVQYALSWQKDNGFFGDYFHSGWIPAVKMKYLSTGTETALRFLSEMGIPDENPAIKKCHDYMIKDDWCPDPSVWSKVVQPEIGLFGPNHIRTVAFAWFGIEHYEFIQTEIGKSFEYVTGITNITSIEDFTGTYGGKLYFLPGVPFPDLYCLKLLAFTKSWRNDTNFQRLAMAVNRLIALSPLPQIYIKFNSQLVAPATIKLQTLNRSLQSFDTKDWFWWMHTMELFARMGIVGQVEALRNQVLELMELLKNGGGFFPFKPHSRNFVTWGVYPGLALESSWKQDRWKLDLTFRSLLILKYSGLL